MDRARKRRRFIELGKDVLIVALTCSALWLAARAQVLGPLSGLLREETPQTGGSGTQIAARVDAARPLRITANLVSGSGLARHGVQYDAEGADALFQQVAGLLVEALSSSGTPEQVTRSQWERALAAAPGVCLDFQGSIPMPVLTGWLAGEDTDVDAAVRRLVLTVWQDSVALYFRDEGTGRYYRCLSQVANELHLTEALSALTDNGAFYAFESEQYDSLDRDTLLTADAPSPTVYAASNPAAGGQETLKGLMEDLGLPVSANSFYSVGGEWVARVGNDRIRLSDRGVVEYSGGEESGELFLVSTQPGGAALFEAVEACRQLAAATVGERSGQARLYLMSVRESQTGYQIEFGYSLNGIQVRLETGAAASFQVENGRITQFTLCLRSYADSGETSVVMPARQAAAALEALGLEGEELLLIYSDMGGETVTASWAAAESGPSS